jgi:hypothetical protein
MLRTKRAKECKVRKFVIYEGVFLSFVLFSFFVVQANFRELRRSIQEEEYSFLLPTALSLPYRK